MQLHQQHTGQGGELLSSTLEPSPLRSWLLLYYRCPIVKRLTPLGPKSDVRENTFQITSLISSMTINIVSCDFKCFIFPHTKNNLKRCRRKKKKTKNDAYLFIFSSFILIFKTMTCCWVLNFSDPNFVKLLWTFQTKLFRCISFSMSCCCRCQFLLQNIHLIV